MKPLGTIQILPIPLLNSFKQIDFVHFAEAFLKPVYGICFDGFLEQFPHKRIQGQIVLGSVFSPLSNDLFIKGKSDVLQVGPQ